MEENIDITSGLYRKLKKTQSAQSFVSIPTLISGFPWQVLTGNSWREAKATFGRKAGSSSDGTQYYWLNITEQRYMFSVLKMRFW